tara:strand:+ start:160 stop:561 length:402 start_codon:yes stop_codon:yes gene_type:complete
MTGVIMKSAWPSVKRPSSLSKNTTPSLMSDNSTNSAISGYRKGKQTPTESKPIFLDTAKTRSIREGSVVRVPDVLGGKPLEGRVLFVDSQDTPKRRLDGKKLQSYFTVCYNEETLGGLLVYQCEWEKVEVIRY